MKKGSIIEFNEAVQLVKDANISEEGGLTFIAAVLIFIGYEYKWDAHLISVSTGYDIQDIELIISNFLKYEILVDGKINMEIDEKFDERSELHNIIEVTLLAACGAGLVARCKEPKETQIIETKKTIMDNTKSLNTYLFEQLHRLSEVEDMKEYELEMNKATSIIDISQQIINVARMKLDIMQAGISIADGFTEIANESNGKAIENGHESIEIIEEDNYKNGR